MTQTLRLDPTHRVQAAADVPPATNTITTHTAHGTTTNSTNSETHVYMGELLSSAQVHTHTTTKDIYI